MAFFEKGAFASEKETILKRQEKKEKNGEFFGEGRFIATLNSVDLKQYTKPGPKKGSNYIMIECTVLKVLEQDPEKNKIMHKEGDLVKIMWDKQGYFGEKMIELCKGLFQVGVNDVTEDMGNSVLDGALDGIPCQFDRLRVFYEKDGAEKSYVPDGLTRPLTKDEAEEFKLDKKVMDLLS
jgi:hypothetical protein